MRLLPLLSLWACADPLALRAPPPSQTLDLTVTPLQPGERTTWTVTGLNRGERVTLVWSTALSTRGPCPPVAGGLCLDIANPPTVLATATADNAGVAVFSTVVPATLAAGATYAFQAVALRGAGAVDSTKSDAVARVVGRLELADLQPGELVITELMINPTVADAVGEWVELHNASGRAVNLRGLVLRDDGTDRYTVPTDLIVAADDLVVLGGSTDPRVNGGMAVDRAWSTFVLGSGADEVVLEGPSGELDAVRYSTYVDFPRVNDNSVMLDGSSVDPALNDLAERWCAASPAASPGAANADCPIVAVCGDGVMAGGEACDDANLDHGDGCSDACQIEPCGDGDLDPGEGCDDGNLLDGDGCDRRCFVEQCLVQLPRGYTTLNPSNSGHGTPVRVGSAQLSDGDLLWLGRVSVSGGPLGNRDGAYVVRVDGATLQAEWARVFTHPHLDFDPKGVAAAPGEAAWIVADINDTQRRDDIAFIRVDGAGQVTMSGQLSGGVYDYEYATGVAATPDGGVAFSGYKYYTNQQDDSEAVLGKITPAGAVQWSYSTDTAPFATDRMDGVIALRDGTVIGWGSEDPYDIERREVTLQRVHTNGTLEREAHFEYEGFIKGAAEMWNGNLVVSGEHIYQGQPFVAAITPGWSLAWIKRINHPTGQEFEATAPSVMPGLCAGAPTQGGACAGVGDRCANSAGDMCTCGANRAWTCGPERAQIDLGWSLTGAVGTAALQGGFWMRLDGSGSSVDLRRLGSGTPTGAGWTAPDGGWRTELFGQGRTIGVLDTDTWHDAACDQTEETGLSTASSSIVWRGSNVNRTGSFLTSALNNNITGVSVPLPPSTTVCSDRACN